MARPTPVFPDVGSTIVPPGRSFPSRSAASIIDRAMRSFTLPPGFMNSSLATSRQRIPRPIRSSFTSGEFATRSSRDSATFMVPERILTAARVGSPGFISEGSGVRRKALIAIVVGLALIATGCGKSKKSSKKSSKAATEAAATRTVNVDGQTDKFNGAFLAYFPNEVQVRPGDTVDFKEIFTGEPHSVKLADDITPGAYHYYCNLHGPDMSGTITVKPKGTAIPSAADVENAGKSQLADHVSKVEAAHTDAVAGKALPAGATALAGFGV